MKFTRVGLFKIFYISVWISLSFLRNCNMWRYCHVLLILAFIYMVLMLGLHLNCAPSNLWETDIMFWVITLTLCAPCGKNDT